MEIEYLTSQYAANKIESIPKILGIRGYESAFFHGATNGSMNFDVFAENSGFDSYYGRNEYDNDVDFDGTWGIYDEEFYQKALADYRAYNTFVDRSGREIEVEEVIFSKGDARVVKKPWYKFW